jgi:hypothetical protein
MALSSSSQSHAAQVFSVMTLSCSYPRIGCEQETIRPSRRLSKSLGVCGYGQIGPPQRQRLDG